MTNTAKNKTDELFQTITNSIIASIEKGQVAGQWQKPWKAMSLPTNVSTGKNYEGINLLWFWSVADGLGYQTNIWGTYKQWQAVGAQVRKGEKGTPGVKWIVKTCKDHGDDEQCDKCGRMFPTTFTVFNADQVDGYEIPKVEAMDDAQRFENAEAFFANTGARVLFGGDAACYSPGADTIRLPEFSAFIDAHGYYATLAHEHIHWTGAKDRLDRDLSGRFGEDDYAMEELVAELGAAMLCGHLGIADTPRPDHAQYLSHWLRVLRNDSRALYTAASKATAAVKHLIGLNEKAELIAA